MPISDAQITPTAARATRLFGATTGMPKSAHAVHIPGHSSLEPARLPNDGDEQAYRKQAIGAGKSPQSQALPSSRTRSAASIEMDAASHKPLNPRKRLYDPSEPISPPRTQNTSARLIHQPKTRLISQKELIAEIKEIYGNLTIVEGKCIQLAKEAPPGILDNGQYQALFALQESLLYLHYDFFLTSQHPSATPAVRRLPIKYDMSERLWRHAVHSFLELLRNRPPASLDHMLAFIYLAYSMMTLLLETVPAFEDTWIECLGDLGRYRMAIEDGNVRDREVWAQVARQYCVNRSGGLQLATMFTVIFDALQADVLLA